MRAVVRQTWGSTKKKTFQLFEYCGFYYHYESTTLEKILWKYYSVNGFMTHIL